MPRSTCSCSPRLSFKAYLVWSDANPTQSISDCRWLQRIMAKNTTTEAIAAPAAKESTDGILDLMG